MCVSAQHVKRNPPFSLFIGHMLSGHCNSSSQLCRHCSSTQLSIPPSLGTSDFVSQNPNTPHPTSLKQCSRAATSEGLFLDDNECKLIAARKEVSCCCTDLALNLKKLVGNESAKDELDSCQLSFILGLRVLVLRADIWLQPLLRLCCYLELFLWLEICHGHSL